MGHAQGQPDSAEFNRALGVRLRQIREELFGGDATQHLAHRMGIPEATWLNYEAGCMVPAEILLRFLELTGVEPAWLHHGCGSKFRQSAYSSWAGARTRL